MADDSLLTYVMTAPEHIRGIGEKTADALVTADIHTVFDAVMQPPSAVARIHNAPNAGNVTAGATVALNVTPLEYRTFGPFGKYLRVNCSCSSLKFIDLVFFRVWPGMAEKSFPLNIPCAIEGKLEHYNGMWQIAHPTVRTTPAPEDGSSEDTLFYAMRAGVPGAQFARMIHKMLEGMPEGDILPDNTGRAFRHGLSFTEAARTLHGMGARTDETARDNAREHLAYVEIFTHALALKLARQHDTTRQGIRINAPGTLAQDAERALPFTLTQGQQDAIAEITEDLAKDAAMMRLLQGDVGSGKTAVALLTALHAIDAGYQAALMAPTELLARQHMEAASKLLPPLGITPILLTGSVKGAARKNALDMVENGQAQLAIGTHALFQDGVTFRRLGYAVIDEQHRFGVGQRMALADKAPGVNMLLMSATPIPRTLTLALYGDISVSRLAEKPAGRQSIDTRVLPLSKLDAVAARVAALAKDGGKIYWICPLVNESDDPDTDITAAETRAESLKTIISKALVALAHGQMKPAERQAAMEAFRSGAARVLVATTVIEVGVDVPDATVIIIEHAERFGLSQLHQLRGRVGRGEQASSCVLLYGPTGNTGFERLQAMRRCDDGFILAEEDLRLRGSGNLLGTEQSGSARFRCADIFIHKALFEDAHHTATNILAQENGRDAITGLLQLFGYDARKTLLKTG